MRALTLVMSGCLLACGPEAMDDELLAADESAVSGLTPFFGNTHAHTDYSDGDKLPADHFKLAKANGYDFYAVTDHSLAKYPGYTPAHYEDTKTQANAFTDATFVGLWGYEFSENSGSTGLGHLNGINTAGTLDASAPGVSIASFQDALAAESASRPVVASFNHPGLSSYGGFAGLTPARREVMAMLEVINHDTVHYDAFLKALDKGWRVAPNGALDDHVVKNITAVKTRTVVLAPALTRADVLEAMRLRRVYATHDANLRLDYTANGKPLGSVLTAPGDLQFDIAVSDPNTSDAADKITRIDVITEGGAIAASRNFNAYSVRWRPLIMSATKKYYFVVVYTPGRSTPTAYAAPVWVE